MPYRFMCKGVEQTSEQRCEICKADLHHLSRSKNASKRANLFSKNRCHLSDNAHLVVISMIFHYGLIYTGQEVSDNFLLDRSFRVDSTRAHSEHRRQAHRF